MHLPESVTMHFEQGLVTTCHREDPLCHVLLDVGNSLMHGTSCRFALPSSGSKPSMTDIAESCNESDACLLGLLRLVLIIMFWYACLFNYDRMIAVKRKHRKHNTAQDQKHKTHATFAFIHYVCADLMGPFRRGKKLARQGALPPSYLLQASSCPWKRSLI